MTKVTIEPVSKWGWLTAPRRALVIGATGYLALSFALFWHVWSLSPSGAATCTCSDVAQFAWFLEWPFAALRHGVSPLHSAAMFHPGGVNVLANTSATGLGVLLLPITALFGPLAALNVGVVVAPFASATALMFVAQRWTRSSSAAFVAGALYGFSPLILFHDALGHLNVTFLVVAPLVLACFDDLFVRRRHRPGRVGLMLGLLLVWQFFVGSEELVMIVVASGFALATVAVLSQISRRGSVREAVAHARRGLVTAGAVGFVLLAGPVAYALFGSQHYRGAVWPGRTLSNDTLSGFVSARGGPSLWWDPSRWHFLPSTYLAPALVLLVLGGALLWRRDQRLVVATVLAGVMAWLTVGPRYWFGAWHWLIHLPQMNNVVNDRFATLLFLFVALAFCRVLDHLASWRPSPWRFLLPVAAVVAVLAPYLDNAVHVAPFSASRVWVPTWYQVHAATLAPGQVVLGFPLFNTSANLLAVQALYEMRYSVVGGTTPQWLVQRQGLSAPGYGVLWDVASTSARATLAPRATSVERTQVRDALARWEVTYVVVPFTNGPNTSFVARAPVEVERWLSSVLGPPNVDSGAWVWHLGVLPAR